MRTAVIFLAFVVGAAHGQYVDEETDSIVIEAADGGEDDVLTTARKARQFLFRSPLPLPVPVGQAPLIVQAPAPGSPLGPIESQPCVTKDERQGTCTTFKRCYPYFKTFALQPEESWIMGSYDTCSHHTADGRHVFGVCCAPQPLPDPDAVAEEEEEEEEDEDATIGNFTVDFQEVNEACGQRNRFNNAFRIINGQIASINEFPFMAAMLNRNRQFCGGSVITKMHILTAAHCVSHMSKYDVQNLKVVLGDHNLKLTGETRGTIAEHGVKRVIRHKRFDSTSLWNDVAILTLDRPITFKSNIQPICLSDNPGNSFAGEIVEVAGWGTTRAGGGASSDILRKVDVRVWTNAQCKSSYGINAPGGIQDHMVCASLPEKSQDSCSGDSGGPLFKCTHLTGGCQQMGIVSWGIGCARAEYPGVYSRVTSLLPWIKRIVKKY